jgi:hypothetical protein
MSFLARIKTKIIAKQHGLPENAIKAFNKLANLQRGAPEEAMLKVAKLHPGVLSFLLEHVGDLTHRMNESFYHGLDTGRDLVLGKVEKCLYLLKRGSRFEHENEDNIRNNSVHQSVSEKEFRTKLKSLLDDYAEAHAKLPVYNKIQWIARQAAVTLGKQKFSETQSLLEKLDSIAADEKTYVEMLGQYQEKNGELVMFHP